jgi:hypothetical protein
MTAKISAVIAVFKQFYDHLPVSAGLYVGIFPAVPEKLRVIF